VFVRKEEQDERPLKGAQDFEEEDMIIYQA